MIKKCKYGHTSKKFERLRHAFQNRFCTLSRQRDRERRVGVRPHQNQHVDLPATVRKADGDLTEVGFDPLSGGVVERKD